MNAARYQNKSTPSCSSLKHDYNHRPKCPNYQLRGECTNRTCTFYHEGDGQSSNSRSGSKNGTKEPQFYHYRDNRAEIVSSQHERNIGRHERKLNLVDQTLGENRRLKRFKSDADFHKSTNLSKKLKEDLKGQQVYVESFEFPECLIWKRGSTIHQIKALSGPAVISVPRVCNSKKVRVIKIEGSKSEVDKAKVEIFEILKEKNLGHLVEHFNVDVNNKDSKSKECDINVIKKEALEQKDSEIKSLREKLRFCESAKKDFQMQIARLIDTNSDLRHSRVKLERKVCGIQKEKSSEVDLSTTFKIENLGLKNEIKDLKEELRIVKVKKDFCSEFDNSWKEGFEFEIEEQKKQMKVIVKELNVKDKLIKEKDLLINDLEKSLDNTKKDYLALEAEMELDFIQCEQCEEKFRSNELLKRHSRFEH